MDPLLPTIEVNPGRRPVASILFMHGLGSDAYDLCQLPEGLQLPEDLPVRFVFPQAPYRPVTVNQGAVMRAWYDVLRIGAGEQDRAGFQESAAALSRLLQREIDQGLPPARVILAGFSQGGAMALHVGLHRSPPVGGIVVLSSYLTEASLPPPGGPDGGGSVPIFMAHGTQDPVVALPLGEQTLRLLQARGHGPEWRTYPMPHAVCAEEIRDLAGWLRRILESR